MRFWDQAAALPSELNEDCPGSPVSSWALSTSPLFMRQAAVLAPLTGCFAAGNTWMFLRAATPPPPRGFVSNCFHSFLRGNFFFQARGNFIFRVPDYVGYNDIEGATERD